MQSRISHLLTASACALCVTLLAGSALASTSAQPSSVTASTAELAPTLERFTELAPTLERAAELDECDPSSEGATELDECRLSVGDESEPVPAVDYVCMAQCWHAFLDCLDWGYGSGDEYCQQEYDQCVSFC